jgi:hypothetical protein
MPYQAAGKGLRIKERGGRGISWTVASSFDGNDGEQKVTLNLSDPATGNTFYEKHILRYGQSNQELLDVRRSANKKGNINDLDLYMLGLGMGVEPKGAPASTVIDISKINFNRMLYCIANAMYKNRMTMTANNSEVDIEFEQRCIRTASPQGREGWSDTMIVGARLIGSDGRRWTFDINHCVGAG